jgi:anti-anti-sigma factor
MTFHFRETPDKIIVSGKDALFVDDTRTQEITTSLLNFCVQAADNAKRVIVDFRGVQFISSTMIGKLVFLNKMASQQSVDLRFANVREEILELLKITRLNSVFRYDDEDPDQLGSGVPIPKPPSTLDGHAKLPPEQP